ncbi:hypothetical protein EOD39_9610 [Acipenser ruthenus]|uniref:Uncharacterized protein n=1 Tax=Acipenser ruthenus TaxID=7906 RepID=A0A444U082_ACIRT|nr:hypothetical protein EOD39_9610 [Acipenser ruthenus]
MVASMLAVVWDTPVVVLAAVRALDPPDIRTLNSLDGQTLDPLDADLRTLDRLHVQLVFAMFHSAAVVLVAELY